jgi:Family of unknown function (DUF5719)
VKSVSAIRIVVPLLVVVALGAVYGLVAFSRSTTLGAGRQVQPPRSAAATSVMRACPSLGLAGSAATDVALIAAPATAGQGLAQVSRLGGSASATSLHSVTSPGQLSIATVRAAGAARHAPAAPPGSLPVPTAAAQGGVIVQASGSMARGLEVEQITAGGIPAARCESPGTDFWFVGPGQHGLARIQLYLVNAGSQTADANVEAFTDAGPLQSSPDTGITVAPHSMVVQSLATVLRGSRAVVLHVRTSVGQVVAAVEESTRTGGGGAWLPVAQTPATTVVLPGLPAAAGTRELFVAVPGTQDAHLKLTAVTSRGSYPPTGSTGLDIPGGSAAAIVLPSLSGIPAALRLSANVPVTASVMLAGGSAGAPGVFTAASLPLEEQGVVAYDKAGGGMASQLVLSAPGRAVRARITEIGLTGSAAAPQIVQISAGHSLLTQLGKGGGASHKSAFSVMITPLAGSGQLYAGRVIIGSGTGGKVQSLLPVSSALTMVPLPHVQNTFITTGP